MSNEVRKGANSTDLMILIPLAAGLSVIAFIATNLV